MMPKGHKILRIIILSYFIVFALLLFFSNTLRNIMLPKVSVAYPRSGYLERSYQAQGRLYAAQARKIYIKDPRIVKYLFVQDREIVQQGQIIAVLYDEKLDTFIEAQQFSEDIKQRLDLDFFSNLAAELLHSYDLQIAQLSMAKAENEMNIAKKLYAENFIAKEKYLEAENIYLNSKIQFERAQIIYDNNLKEKINALHEIIITAPITGVITNLRIVEGSLATNDIEICSLTSPDSSYVFNASIPDTLEKHLTIGDTFPIHFTDPFAENRSGVVSNIRYENQEFHILTLEVGDSKALKAGEKGVVFINKRIGHYDKIVENSAINYENNTPFLWVLKEMHHALGSEWIVVKQNIDIIDSDNFNTAISRGVELSDLIVTNSNKILTSGISVYWE